MCKTVYYCEIRIEPARLNNMRLGTQVIQYTKTCNRTVSEENIMLGVYEIALSAMVHLISLRGNIVAFSPDRNVSDLSRCSL